MGFAYYAEAQQDNAVLLPTWKRTEPVPGGKGGFGQANVRYLCESGKRLRLPWAERALEYVQSYASENLLTHLEGESLAAIEEALELS